MTVKNIVIKYLKENGYDGLYNKDAKCGCKLDDLMPCYDPQDCSPGMLKNCHECDNYINGHCLNEYDFCIHGAGVEL